MAIQARTTNNGNTVNILIEGRFVFDSRHDFGSAYKEQKNRGIMYRIDFSKTEYMDSSALGMLLMLKEHADANGGKVMLCRMPTKIKKIIVLTKFHELFAIED